MESISLIIPMTAAGVPTAAEVDAYRRTLLEHPRVAEAEIVLAGEDTRLIGSDSMGEPGMPVTPGPANDLVAAVRRGMAASSHGVIVVLDPRRGYAPEALGEVIDAVIRSGQPMAIAVPRRDARNSLRRKVVLGGLGLASRLSLGTSDMFSGLVAIRRDALGPDVALPYARGARLTLDMLTWPGIGHNDVPVTMRPDDRLPLGPVRVDDVKQMKQLLDHRFGTMSRLVQFCIVGASGMVVDLTLYALLQWLFARTWSLPTGPSGGGFSWPLATAGALSIFTAMVWNFTLNRRLTFNDSRYGSIFRQFLTYALGNALGVAVSLTLRLGLPQYVGFFARHRLAAAVVGIVVATGISFSMSRWVVFIRKPANADPEAPTPPQARPVESALQESVAAS